MANKLVNVNGKFVMQRDTPTSPSRLGPTKIKEALNKTAQQKKAARSSGSVPYASPIAKNVTMDTSPRNYGRPVTNKPHFGLYDDEKSLSNVTLGDVTYKPLLSGYYGQKMNEAIGVNRLSGNTNMNTPQIAKYQGLAQKFEPTRFSNPNAPFGGLLNNAPQGAMSLIGQQVANLTDEDTVMYAGTGAAAGAMIGSVAGLPGSAISAASGLKAGIAAGVGKNMFEAVYGGTYRDLMDAGVSDSTAHKTALISAGVQSALEMAQLDELAKAAKLLRKQNKTVLAEGIEKILIDRGKGVLKNTAEEVAQEGVAMGFEYDAKKLEGLPTDSWQDNVKRAGQTAIDSALSFGLMSVPGVVSTGRQISKYNNANPMQRAVEIAKRTMNPQNQEVQIEQPQIAQFTPDENVKNVLASKFKSTEDVKKWAENLAQKSKFDIEFIADADAAYNGYFKPYAPGESNGKQGKMVVNLHSEDPIKTVFGHELTHILEANSKEYNEYANFAINNLVNRHYGTADITALAEQKAASYAQRGVNLSIDEAKQEIVAELSGEYLFKDEQSITDLYRYNENLFYRIYENIKNMIKSFAGTDEEKDLIKARNLYAKVLKANQKNPGVVQTVQEGDTQVAASYLFAGERATNADKEALAKAQQMESDNADAETIWKETGWFRGPDKKWRWEIDDSKGEYYQGNAEPLTRLKAEKKRYDELFDKFWNSELTKDEEQEMESLWELLKENDIDPKETGTMGDFYKNDDMYAAYPNLKYVGVRNEKMDPNGMYIPDEDTISISKDITDLGNKDRNKSVLLHETQHAVQRREGFSKGGNPETALKLIRRSAKMNLAETGDEKFIELIGSGTIDQINDYVDNVLMEMYNVDNIKDVGYKVYESLQGEVEARVASNRMNMSSDERREKMPSFGNSLLLEELEDDKTFNKALSTQNKRTNNVQDINNEVKPRHKEGEKRTSGNMVAGSDEAAFSMQENSDSPSDSDTKFSLKEPVETTKDLIAAHNLTIDNMMKTLDLGGLPAASIAVTKADMGHNVFGEISVLFYPDTIDGKKNKANKVFAGDAWTQTFPQISQKVSKQAHERLEKRINSLLAGDDKYKDLGYLNLSYDGVQGEIDRWGSFESAYRNSYLIKLAYLRDTGKEFKPVMMEKNFIEDKPVMKAMLQIIGADKAKEWMDKDEMMSYEPKIREAINKYYESVSPGMIRYDKPMTWAEMDRTIGSLRKYASYIENGSPKVIDTRKTEAKFDKAVNMKAYTKWLNDISEGLIEKQGVRNNKDLYTNNGRRSWDQLHDDATLENITKAMTSKDLTGNSFSGGTKFAAGVKKQLGSISDIKKNKDLIKDVSDEEIKAIRDDIDRRLIELVDTVSGNNNDSLFARDRVIDSLLDVALKGKTRDGIKRRLMATQYGNIDKSKLTDKVVDDFVQLIQDAQAVPTRYFEAKPQRAIGLDEIAMVVIPKKGTKELRAALDARGINYKMYDGTAEDRIAKINGVPDVKFSLKDSRGKQLSQKQQEFFKDSKVRDENGNLKVMYHGTPHGEFEVFDAYGSNFGLFGEGIYTTDELSVATGYSNKKVRGKNANPHVFEVYVNIKNPMNMDKKADPKLWNKKLEDYDMDDIKITDSMTNTDAWNEVLDYLSDGFTLKSEAESIAGELIRDMGYDGITHQGGIRIGNKKHRVFIAFEPEQIKTIDNENPTEDARMKFSMKNPVEQVKELKEKGALNEREDTFVPKYSLASWKATDRDKLVSILSEQLERTPEEVEKYLKSIDSVANTISKNKELLDYNANPLKTALKPNSEYTFTVDCSTLCKKRNLFAGTFDALQAEYPDHIFTSEELVELRAIMAEEGYEVPCGICYVESMRKDLGPIAAGFIKDYKGDSEGYIPNMYDLTTTKGYEEFETKHPEAYADYLKAMNARGQQKPKLVETRTDYRNEIIKLSKSKVDSLNSNGGLRLQSYSDFEIPHLIDMLQVVTDMSARGLKGQAYTKIPEFARVLGKTGLKINLSLIAKEDGYDTDGNLIFDDIEGMNHEVAFDIRKKYGENVGTILVGKNDEHIRIAMADDRIDFIIPYHRSGWKASLYDKLGLTGYMDYSKTQNEKPFVKSKAKTKNLVPNSYWDYSKSGDENSKIYLAKCKENKVTPKFPQFLEKDENGDYKAPSGYWKLLIDYKMYDNSGKGMPQAPVMPIFDNRLNQKILKEYSGGHDSYPVAGKAVEKFSAIIDGDGSKFSLKKADAKNIARKIKAYYGSKSTIKDISQELTEIYDMDVNDMMAVNQRIEALAARIAENVPTVNEFEQRIKEFRRYVRNMPIRVDDHIKADIADYGAWSKRYFNRLNLSADGNNIDELYDSLAEQFPEFLDADIANPTDQLMAIAEALDTTRKDKGYSNNEDMMYGILLDIYDDYYRYQADEQAKADEGPEMEPGDDGPGNNGPTDDGDGYGDYDGDTSLARIDVWEHTEPEDRSPYFEKGENPARDINVPQRDEYGRKASRFTRTAAESRALDDKQASELNESVWNGTFSYNVITDQDAINRANDKMERFDNDTLLNGLESKLYDSKIITKDDIALGERLIQEYAKEKNVDSLERAIAVVATAGTRAGQAVQAMRLLKKLSPAGQLMALQKQIDAINTDMKLLGDKKVTLSPERAKDIASSDTPEGLEQAVERAKMELYNKVPSRWVDKWNAWRYLSMLGNPKTHIRNVLGNAIFVPVRGMKNVIGATIEAATVKGERSKAIGKLPKVFKEFAAKEFDENKEAIDAGGKENIERNKRVFKSSLLEGMRKANSFALEAEDQKFLKAAYVRSFAGYLKANKISPALVQKLMSGKGTDIEIGDAATAKIFNNARAYAMNEAQKATYRDYSALANALNKFKKTNAVTAVLGEGLMPFTKTPINILKRGVEYSPVGILKGIKELANDVRKADDDMKQQTILKGIDSMASGLSGTAILALGAFLASQGILSGGGEDDKKERDMAAMMGSQNYSFNMGDVSYTVDWMAPVSLPLFVGVELFNSLESRTVNGFVDIVDAMTSISEPMVNMSMLQGLNRAVTNYDQKDALTSTAADMALGYFSQGVPTLGGQIARTMDATRRTAYVDKNNDIPDTLERPMQNAMAKVPGLSKKLNPYRDSFGRPQTNDSALMRAFENFISPGYVKVKKDDRVLSELQKVYGRTGDKGVLPSLPNKKIGERDLTAKEYDRMAYIKGKQSYDLINTMIRSDDYKDLSAADQAKMISDAYSYAYAMAKDDVLGIKPDGWIAKALDAEKKHDIPVETYISYNNYKNSLKGEGTKAKFIDKIQSDESLTQKQKDKLDDYWYGSIEASKITELSAAEQRQWNVAKNYGFDEEKFSKYVGYITQQGEGKTKMNNINDAVKAGLPRGEAVLLYNIMRQKKYRYNG